MLSCLPTEPKFRGGWGCLFLGGGFFKILLPGKGGKYSGLGIPENKFPIELMMKINNLPRQNLQAPTSESNGCL